MEQKNKKAKYRKAKNNLVLFNSLVSVLLAISLLIAAAFSIVVYTVGDMKKGHIAQDHDSLGIHSGVSSTLPKDIINIALFGIDTRSSKAVNRTEALTGRSDTIIILSINTNNNTIKLTSILRDSWVPINGKISNGKTYNAKNKINAAYGLGGPELAIKTLNQNFHLNITDYVSVSMHQMKNVIDILGGVDIRITEMERRRINELSNDEGFKAELVKNTGLVHLNGTQALSYSRIRDDSEELRVRRQQKVLSCLLEKAKNLAVADYPSVLREILSTVETSMSFDEIFEFSPLLSVSELHLESTTIPGKEVVAQGGIFSDTRGGWVWKYDLEEAKKYIYQWIYGIELEE